MFGGVLGIFANDEHGYSSFSIHLLPTGEWDFIPEVL